MSYKDKYLIRNNLYNSGANKEAYINSTKNIINQLFLNNPSANEVWFNDSIESTWVWIVEDTKVPTFKKIIMKPNEIIKAGWIVHWNGEIWICTYADKSKFYQTGLIEKCNSNLKWVDESGTIQSFPCVLYNSNRYSYGVSSNNIMTIPDGRRQVKVQNNEHTKKIKKYMRFIFGGLAYKVVDFDLISQEGLVNINLEEDQINLVTDNMELEIADYYPNINKDEDSNDENENEIDNPISEYSIIIKSSSTTPSEIKLNQSKQYYVEVYNNGELVTGETVTWELFADDKVSNTNFAIITKQDGLNCTVKNNGVTSGYVQLRAILDSDNTVEAWLRIQMKALF